MERLKDIYEVEWSQDDWALAYWLDERLGCNYVLNAMEEQNVLPPSQARENLIASYEDIGSKLFQAYNQLLERMPDRYDFDMHDGNIMWRESTRSLVFIDPWTVDV